MEPIEDGESYETDGGHPYWGQPGKPHVNPGCDVTVDPRPPIDDSYRERKSVQTTMPHRRHIVDVNMFEKRIEKYVNGTFAFSKGELKETIEEIIELFHTCISEENYASNTEESEQRAGERG